MALRASASLGLTAAAGWAAHDLTAGLLAVLGAFTSLYGADRPYASRAALLAGVAAVLSLSLAMGMATRGAPWLSIPLVALISAAAAFAVITLAVGRPGAFIIALVCAAGTAMPAVRLAPWPVAGLVFAGGMVALLVHSAGALIDPRGPEKSALFAAAGAVAGFVEAIGGPQADEARRAAALSLHQVWSSLVTWQGPRAQGSASITALRRLARRLHLTFAAALDLAAGQGGDREELARRARRIGQAARALPRRLHDRSPPPTPLGRIRLSQALAEALQRGSVARLAATRVLIAATLSGAMAAALGLTRGYWAVAAAVLVLHQGLDWSRALALGLARVLGTFAGLLVAAAVMALRPDGVGVVAALMILQFTSEMLVMRNYALAVVFITATAMVITSGGRHLLDPWPLMGARAADTAIGCCVGLLVHRLTAPRRPETAIRARLAEVLVRAGPVLLRLAGGDVASREGYDARRSLQHALFNIASIAQTGAGGHVHERAAALRLWPALMAADRLGYRLLAAAWSMDAAGAPRARRMGAALLPAPALAAVLAALRDLAEAIEADRPAGLPPELPDLIESDLRALVRTLPAA